MDERIIRYYAGELGRDERETLLREVLSDDALKREMMDYQGIDALFGLHPQNKDELVGRTSLNRFMKARRREKGKKLFFKVFFNVALIFACVVFTWRIAESSVGMDVPQPVAQKLTVPAGQRAHILLADSTSVWVNAGSTLTYPSAFGAERRVSLTGEAYFEVAKGETPFIVSTGKANVRALGTQFNVFNYPSENLQVSLLEGSVKVYHPGKEQAGTVLSPNQQLTDDGGRFVVAPLTDNPVVWKDGIYIFKQQYLHEILKKLELYYDVKFTVKHTSLLQRKYSGMFRQRDGVMDVLRLIQKIHPFQIKQVEHTNEIILYK